MIEKEGNGKQKKNVTERTNEIKIQGVSTGFINLEFIEELERSFSDVGGTQGGNHTIIIGIFIFVF